jgi:hypothetical protein
MATREALEVYSRNDGATTLRNDVDESFLDPRTIPKPGVTYRDDTDAHWISTGQQEAIDKVREILKTARQ